MAINVVIPLLIPLEENMHNSTRLLTGEGSGPLEFSEPRYCALMQEDATLGAPVVSVLASHKKGAEVRYSITGGNKDGLFTIDQHSGVITLAAPLDFEIHDKHELVVAAEAGGATVHAIVQVRVADVNDNAPYFLQPDPYFTVIEEDDRDLPSVVTKVEARDRDRQDQLGLHYTLSGDGVDGYSPEDAYFTINPRTGELIQQRALDRDAPRGKEVWKVKIQVRDGQEPWPPTTHLQDDSLFSSSGIRVRRHGDPKEETAERRSDRERKDDGEIRSIEGLKGKGEGMVGFKEDARNVSKGEADMKRRETRDERECERTENGDGIWRAEGVQERSRGHGEREKRGEGHTGRRIAGEGGDERKNGRDKQRRDKGMERRTDQGEKIWRRRRRRRRNVERETEERITGERESQGSSTIVTTLTTPTINREQFDGTRITERRREGDHHPKNTERPREAEHQLTIPQSLSTKQTAVIEPQADTQDHSHTRVNSLDQVTTIRLEAAIDKTIPTPSNSSNNNSLRVLKSRGREEDNEKSKSKPQRLEKNKDRNEYDPSHLDNLGSISEPELPPSKSHANTTVLKPSVITRIISKPLMDPTDETPVNVLRHDNTREKEAHPIRRKNSDISTKEQKRIVSEDKKAEDDYMLHVNPTAMVLNNNNKNNSGELKHGAGKETACNKTRHYNSTTKVQDLTTSQQVNEVVSQMVNTSTLLTHESRWEARHLATAEASLEQNASKNAKKSMLSKLSLNNQTLSTNSKSSSESDTPEETRMTSDSTREKLTVSPGSGQDTLRYWTSPQQGSTANLSTTRDSDSTNKESINYSSVNVSNSSQTHNTNSSEIHMTGLVTNLLQTNSPNKDSALLNYVYKNISTAGWAKSNLKSGLHHIISKRGIRKSTDASSLSHYMNLGNASSVDVSKVSYNHPTDPYNRINIPGDHYNSRDLHNDNYNPRNNPGNYFNLRERTDYNPRNLPGDHCRSRDDPRYYYHSPGHHTLNDDHPHTPRDVTGGRYNPRHAHRDRSQDINPPHRPRDIPGDHIKSNVALLPRTLRDLPRDGYTSDHYGDQQDMDSGVGGGGGGCEDVSVFGGEYWNATTSTGGGGGGGRWRSGGGGGGGRGRGGNSRVHLVETTVTMLVKDINDNPPVFPNTTMFGEVQENGPIDLSVGVIAAWDADDASEGTNARLTYSIEKNVIHEKTGEAIFTVDPQTGLVRTALCCLDRETTPEYQIQVVASDGGGLKGTGTVVVRLADVNDNSPRLARQMWELEVDETYGDGPPDNTTLLEISVTDKDISNYFFYRVVESSGWGWDHFGMRSVGSVGQLYAIRTLDFENETHRRGFKFMVQVTDRGRGGWTDPRHLDAAWVSVRLRDVNDNPPVFHRPHAHVTVREDAVPGTLLAALPAHDPDMVGTQGVVYLVQGGWGSLMVSQAGDVSLWRALDREAADGALGLAQIIAVDKGSPPLTSTATLTITVTDVNDCAPVLLPPTLLHVTEGAPPSRLGILTATDHDVWALGHGPPFNLSLAPTNPAHVFAHISLAFNSHLDSGRGGAELWTTKSVDRERHARLLVEVVVSDAQGLTATHTVSVVVQDVNDNPMKPATKTVYLWKTQGGGSDAPLGRVYVEDPDDWDLGDKSFSWRGGAPHPLFSLHPDHGTVFASSHVREGRYELQFSVSDRVWRQSDVEANVTVLVRLLTPDTLTHAAPLTLTPVTSSQLTRGWTPKGGGGGLGRLLEAVREVVGGEAEHSSVEVVSVYDLGGDQLKQHDLSPHQHATTTTTTIIHGDLNQQQQQMPGGLPYDSSSPQQENTRTTLVPHAGPPWLLRQEDDDGGENDEATRPSTCVWVSVKQPPQGRFMDPIKLQGLLGLHTNQLEIRTGLTVVAEDPTVSSSLGGQQQQQDSPRDESEGASLPVAARDPSSVATSPSTALPLQVVDTNTTSLVTPRLTRAHPCHAHDPETCTPTSCLNGGRCIRTPQGNRCVCPQGSSGPRCKVLARSFFGKGWAWVRPLPPCLPTTLSLRVLTRRPDALLLYSGPLAPHPRRPHHPPTPMLALQLVEGRPEVLVEGTGGPLRLVVNTTVHDGDWHSIHLHVHSKGVVVLVDLCGRGWQEATDDSHCVTRASWANTVQGVETWAGAWPVQVGGLAHYPPLPEDHGWGVAPIPTPLHGCISHLTLNGQLVDVGEPAYSWASQSGCRPQEASCTRDQGWCGYRGKCVGGLNQPHCDCEAGWAGTGCATPTVPANLGTSSYLKVALSFTPDPRKIWVQVRVRTRGQRNGQLLHLAAQHRAAAFTLHLRAGVACASVSGAGLVARVACVDGRPVGDGAWHTIRAERHGHNLVVSVDDGDGWRRNESLVSLLHPGLLTGDDDDRPASPPAPLEIDKHDGVTVGGMPEFTGVSLIAVHNDLRDTCVDDLRVSGRSLPLPPGMNGTTWGQVTTSASVSSGCVAPDACLNTTCSPPLTCTSNWGHAACSCGLGRHLSGHNTCEDLDECLWSPCLHGGTCYNVKPGYQCVCDPSHAGDNCQWTSISSGGHPLAAPVAIAALTVSLLLLVVLGVFLSVRLRRQLLGRALNGRQVRDVGGEEEVAMTVKVTGCTDEGGGGGGGKTTARHDTFLECIKYNLQQPPLSPPPSPPPPPRKKECQITMTLGEPDVACTQSGREESCRPLPLPAQRKAPPDPVLPRDDLRAYAYEGDGSSSGSLGSAKSGLKTDLEDEANIKPLVCEFLEVMDLLRNLPEASKSPSLFTRRSKAGVEEERQNGSSVDRQTPDQTTTTTTNHPVPLPTLKSHTITTTTTNQPLQSSQMTKTYAAAPAPGDPRKALQVSSTPCSSPSGREELSTPC